jgi:hypothetical protein
MYSLSYRIVIVSWRIVMHTLCERYLLLYGRLSVHIMSSRDLIRVVLDRRSAQLVVKDQYQYLAHRRAHLVRKVLTPLLPAHVAYHARQGRTVRLDRRSANLVLRDHHQRLGHRPALAQNNMFIE